MNGVSIVIPTFNRVKLLEQTIESCLNQTYPCEVIVCDHGSTDATPSLVESYGHKLKYIRREQDFGPHFCWLEGVLNANNPFIHLQYDDDLIKPDFIEKTRALLNHDVGFVFTACELLRKFRPNQYQFIDAFNSERVSSLDAEPFILENLISPGCVLIRKRDAVDALYQGKLPFSTSHYKGVGPDFFLTLICLLRYENIAFINEPMAQFRVHAGSITVDAYADEEKKADIAAAYSEVKEYYKILKAARVEFS